MTTTATAPVQEALFGRFGEVQTDLLDAIADAEREATPAGIHDRAVAEAVALHTAKAERWAADARVVEAELTQLAAMRITAGPQVAELRTVARGALAASDRHYSHAASIRARHNRKAAR